MKRALLIGGGSLLTLVAVLVAWSIYTARETEPEKAATRFVQALSNYNPDTPLDSKLLEIEAQFVEGSFKTQFDASSYAKGFIFNKSLGVSQEAKITKTKAQELKDSFATVAAYFTLITSSPEESTQQKFEQVILLKKVGNAWKVDSYEERSVDG